MESVSMMRRGFFLAHSDNRLTALLMASLFYFTSCSEPAVQEFNIDVNDLVQQERLDEASAAIAEALVEHPDNADLLYNLACIQRLQGNLVKANNTAERALKINPTDDAIRLLLVEIALDTGKIELAWDHFSKMSRKTQRSARAQAILAVIQAHRGQWMDAEKNYHTAAELGDRSVVTRASIAFVSIKQGRIEEGKAYLKEAEALPNPSQDGLRQIAECYLELGNAQRARELALELSQNRPKDARVWSLLGRAEMILLRFPEAESAFTRALASPNVTPWTKVEYALMLFAAQREDESLTLAIETEAELEQQNEPIRNPALYNLMATLYARREQLLMAHRYLQKSLQVDPRQPRVRALLNKVTLNANAPTPEPPQ